MMKYYQEITLIPSLEIPIRFLMSKVFYAIHLALASSKDENGKSPIGVSFPTYEERALGNKIRLLSDCEEALEHLGLNERLQKFVDYVHITGIRKIPESRIRGYLCFTRFQPDGSVPRKARRYAKRHSVTYEEAEKILKTKEHACMPYIQLTSHSTNQKFSLLIQKRKMDHPLVGTFSTYGLSDTSTVPDF